MQRSKDDVSGISIKSKIVFTRWLGVFTQSLELWAQLVEKSV
jgi:hypothetical protein